MNKLAETRARNRQEKTMSGRRVSKDVPIGIEALRRAVTLFSNCNETFNQSLTSTELLVVARGYWRSGWDVTPDAWSDAYLDLVLSGAPTDQELGDPREYPGVRKGSLGACPECGSLSPWRCDCEVKP
jgi:hypothetical protein